MDEDIDFNFETGEIVRAEEYDVVDFHAHVEGFWGRACVTNRVKIPRRMKQPPRIHICLNKTPREALFLAKPHWNTRTPWKEDPIPFIHESLI